MNPIQMFFHCRKCTINKPMGVSPADQQRITAGLDSEQNIVIWCERCEEEITTIRKINLAQNEN